MDYGGAELRTIDLLKNLDKNKYKMYFCSLSGETGELDEEIKRLGGEVIYCKLKDPLFPYKFIKKLIKNKINVVHSNVYFFSGIILLLAKLGKVNTRIAHFRTTNSGKEISFFNKIKYRIFKRIVLKNATNIVGVSKTSLEENFGKKIFEDVRVQIIYNGLDLEKLNKVRSGEILKEENLRIKYNIDNNNILFIHVGRMNKAKNHLKIIEVFNAYLKQEGNAKLFLIGKEDPEIKKILEDKIIKYKISKDVHYLGVQSNVYTYLNQTDILIFPSIREGLPGVILEATAAGLPVIASDIKPNKEVAQYFEMIKCISNSESSAIWAKEIKKIISNKPSKSVMYNEFLESPFVIKKNIGKYQEILPQVSKGGSHEVIK